jgi:lysophospholipase L1-like esterase
VVFGFAPHDSLTITGFLNRIQADFFFVNAGVPSWVSSQVRRRVVNELLSHQPALIVFWGGHNDASLAYGTAKAGLPFDPALIERPSYQSPIAEGPIERLVSSLFLRLDRLVSGITSPAHQPDPGAALAAAQAFVENMEAAFDASSRVGARFLAVYQPILHHHNGRPAQSCEIDQCEFFALFRDRAAALAARFGLPYLDLGDVFDRHFATVPVFIAGTGPDLNDQVFIDQVHLYVPGNALVAREIAARIAELAVR